ncbi:hypothetical protein C5Y96_10640 [Blastopirellula marina]|uniref:Uncharacterized protein n=1 Tax=Blastopirellula marina TaxID=124 RepID=A0A2S8FMU5_9BACT|nr:MULTISPECIES: hypothetical protein [Pirellulaceae]PQO33300.1 hypothetical protein C5Y96_10640 [Blastopirellula marina]RCS52389.1 hypothetical protein DTL36_10650 [Bremerella cremea]
MLRLSILAAAVFIVLIGIYVVVQGVLKLNNVSATDTPASTKRDGVVFAVVGVLLVLVGIAFGFFADSLLMP